MLTLLDGSCDRLTEGNTTLTTVSGLSSSSPGTGQHSDGQSSSVIRYDTIRTSSVMKMYRYK